jgi:hypothetical protein
MPLGVDVGLGQHAAAEQDSDLVGVDLVRLGLAAVDGPHVQGVAEDEGDLLLQTQVGAPVPGEQALAGHGEPLAERSDGRQEGFRARGDGLGENGFAGRIEDVEGEGPGVEVDAAVESVLRVVEPHHGLRGMG